MYIEVCMATHIPASIRWTRITTTKQRTIYKYAKTEIYDEARVEVFPTANQTNNSSNNNNIYFNDWIVYKFGSWDLIVLQLVNGRIAGPRIFK